MPNSQVKISAIVQYRTSDVEIVSAKKMAKQINKTRTQIRKNSEYNCCIYGMLTGTTGSRRKQVCLSADYIMHTAGATEDPWSNYPVTLSLQ